MIDFHTHVFPPFMRDDREAFFSREPAFKSIYRSPGARLSGVEGLLRDMDEAGIRRSVIFGFPWETAGNFQRHNDYVMEAAARHPDRLTGFCCFSPLSPGGAAEAERCLESGLSGVGELAVYGGGLTPDVIRRMEGIMDVCSRFDAPLLLHTNEPVGHMYPGKAPMTLSQIYELLKTYPSNRIILAHWGGGIFFYALMKKEVRKVLQNVWLDTAASPYLYTPDIYRVAGEVIGFERILFGTDYPLLKAERYLREMAGAGLASGDVERITALNAAEVLGL